MHKHHIQGEKQSLLVKSKSYLNKASLIPKTLEQTNCFPFKQGHIWYHTDANLSNGKIMLLKQLVAVALQIRRNF